MSNIKSYGIALPHYRIEECILHPNGKQGMMKAICFADEDIISLAYEAASAIAETSIDALFFATATPVFQNRYHASYLANLLHLPQSILALDFIGTYRGGTDALLLANQLVDSGNFQNILVIAADVSFPEVGDELSGLHGHAACALCLSKEPGIANIIKAKSYSAAFAEEFNYKNAGIQYDPRFSREEGFLTNIKTAVKDFVSEAKKYDAVILNSKYARAATSVFAKAGFEEQNIMKDTVQRAIGNTGSAHALILLIQELENKKQQILLLDYCNGSNLFEIKNSNIQKENKLAKCLNSFNLVNTYQDYLLLRKAGNFNDPGYQPKEIFSSEMMQQRDTDALLHLKAERCDACGTIYYLKSTYCKNCKHDKFSEVQLNKTGVVYTYTKEHYFPSSFPPVPMLVIDLHDGGRITVQQTDTMYPNKNEVKIGAEVKLVLRKMMESDLKPNYFWKAILNNEISKT